VTAAEQGIGIGATAGEVLVPKPAYANEGAHGACGEFNAAGGEREAAVGEPVDVRGAEEPAVPVLRRSTSSSCASRTCD
jgi:hypothetical protein